MDLAILRSTLKGTATLIPGVSSLGARGTGGTNSARYCYTVWLRHLVHAHQAGLLKKPDRVGEIGPGESIGVGLAALLSGASHYTAIDAKSYISREVNLKIFDELVELFQERSDIPDEKEFPRVWPLLESYAFPENVISQSALTESLNDDRIASIRGSISQLPAENPWISYAAPWTDKKVISEKSIDLLISQAVLEHIDDLEAIYNSMARWVKPGAMISHVIDYSSHGHGENWDSHWAIIPLHWRLIRGKRLWLLNRMPHSYHVALITKHEFHKIKEIRRCESSTLPKVVKSDLEGIFQSQDFETRGALVQAFRS
ncbi:methyltransferase domain-containing protein [Spiribacter sp. 221]|uniref:methyltransferase domain-containing protein n=1 Tax=Spiribacter onubensis TaxID=3122420 RepID=UPI00349F2FEB